MNFIDTSPFYGRGMSEVLLGVALRGVPRDSLPARHQARPVQRHALRLLGHARRRERRRHARADETDHLDIILCHDIEFVDMRQIVEETLPAVRKLQKQGKVRFVGISGYPMNIFSTSSTAPTST